MTLEAESVHRDLAAADTVRILLESARRHLDMDVAWLSTLDGSSLQYDVVVKGGDVPAPVEGGRDDLDGSYCARVLAGDLPSTVPQAREHPVTAALEITDRFEIGAYAGVPVRSAGGAVLGMLCCTAVESRPHLAEEHARFLSVLADVVAATVPAMLSVNDDAAVERDVAALIDGKHRHQVLQPIVDARSGRVLGFESLLRVELEPFRPDLWLGLAERVGRRTDLEVAVAQTALRGLELLEPHEYLSINLSARAITERAADVLEGVDLRRVVVELTEHEQVADYDVLLEAITPYRAAGLRIAVDDAGAGHSSFRHILRMSPAVIKADLDLVREIHRDPARQALLSAMLGVAGAGGATVVAEGVETQEQLDCLLRLGVSTVQGYLLARPSRDPVRSGFPAPTRPPMQPGMALAAELGRALRSGEDLPQLVDRVLSLVLEITGLETSYITVLDADRDELDHRWVRNAGRIALPAGTVVPWSESLCHTMELQELVWSGAPEIDLAQCRLAAEFGLGTFVSIPILDAHEVLIGTLCAGSTDRVFLTERVIAQLHLLAHALSDGLVSSASRTTTQS